MPNYKPRICDSPAFKILTESFPVTIVPAILVATWITEQTYALGAESMEIAIHEIKIAVGGGPTGPLVATMAGYTQNENGRYYSKGPVDAIHLSVPRDAAELNFLDYQYGPDCLLNA